ncbi:MAG: hypothetical protein J6V13_03235 [Paludibacteraceae bacterium]|nr:hypothetical protein [Paludibacteraceae bacterium]MBO7259310.1 hypothetical protein [Paludibacteraceae bacterium]
MERCLLACVKCNFHKRLSAVRQSNLLVRLKYFSVSILLTIFVVGKLGVIAEVKLWMIVVFMPENSNE